MGVASRRDIKAMIKNGRIFVDGSLAKAGDMKCDTEAVRISVDGRELSYKKQRYIMLNKPGGFVCAAEDSRDRTVMELLDDTARRQGFFSVGRLDKDTEGLLIMTNDGDYAHKIISPKSDIVKKYYAKVSGMLEKDDIAKMKDGLILGDGTKCLPAGLEIISETECIVSVSEGKYHQVKRMLASLSKPVLYLKRLSIGGLELDETLQLGAWRELSEKELALSLLPVKK
jgi:pseudouridine synthase